MYQKRNKELEVLRLYLSDYSKRFYLREISKISRLPLKNVQRALESLERSKILKSEVSGKNKYFFLNLDNIGAKIMLLQAEAHSTLIFLEKYAQFKLFVKEIKTDVPIIIFGSFAKLSATKDSDVDILVVSGKEISLPAHLLPNKIHKIRISEKNFVKSSVEGETLIKKAQDSHIIINNHSFFINFMWEKYAKQH